MVSTEMSGEWDVAGSIIIRTRKSGKRYAIEASMDEILMDVGLYAEGKYGKGIEVRISSPVVSQTVANRMKP